MSAPSAEHLVLHVQKAGASNFGHGGFVLHAEFAGRTALLVTEFRRHQAPPLAIGEVVDLSLPELSPDGATTFAARVANRSEDRNRVRYTFEVGQSLGLVVSKTTDWRFAARIAPFPQAPIEAFVGGCQGGTRFPVGVKDISATGVGLLVPVVFEPKLFSEWKLRLWLQLPGETSQSIELLGNVCSRRMEGRLICYGIDFDSVATVDFGSKQASIHEYTARCQAAALDRFRKGAVDLHELPTPSRAGHADGEAEPMEASSEECLAYEELDSLAGAWSDLPTHVRKAILVLVEAAHTPPALSA